MTDFNKLTAALGAAAVMAGVSRTAHADEGFISRIQSEDANVRCQAWQEAYKQPASVVSPLCDLLLSANPGIARAADEALKVLIHSTGVNEADPKRAEVTAELIGVLGRDDYVSRIQALRLLSLVANGDSVPAIAPFLKIPNLREEAVYCLQRIPGMAATDALVEELHQAPRSFQPRIMAALEQRKDSVHGSVYDALMKYVDFSDAELAVAAVGAIAAGAALPSDMKAPDVKMLTPVQQRELIDSALRSCEHWIADGKNETAGQWLKKIIEADEEEIGEHVHCAAILVMAEIDHPQVRAVLQDKAENASYIVRDTAKKALASMG